MQLITCQLLKTLQQIKGAILGFLFLCLSVNSHSDAGEDPTPTMQIGAEVYSQRCVLCHGERGMGEGILPMKLSNYPDTNLVKKGYTQGRDKVKQIIVYGGNLKDVHEAMPPYGQELSWTETESVTNFVELLRNSPEEAKEMVSNVRASKMPLSQLGKEVYDTRCVLCHGRYGEGDGRMSKLLKDPPPFDLTASRAPEPYLKAIIEKGGEAMGRSKHMPPWGDQLSEAEVDALIAYLQTIRD